MAPGLNVFKGFDCATVYGIMVRMCSKSSESWSEPQQHPLGSYWSANGNRPARWSGDSESQRQILRGNVERNMPVRGRQSGIPGFCVNESLEISNSNLSTQIVKNRPESRYHIPKIQENSVKSRKSEKSMPHWQCDPKSKILFSHKFFFRILTIINLGRLQAISNLINW